MIAVIMAGGKGTRLVSLTRDLIPKPMVSIQDKPILEWQIEKLRQNGVTEIILVIGYRGEVIREYFGDGSRHGVSIYYYEEIDPLGTGGALYHLKPMLSQDCFLLLFGDILFDIDIERMMQFHIKKHSIFTLFVHPNDHPHDSDIILTNETKQVIGILSKNEARNDWYDNCVNAGIYIIDPVACGCIQTDGKMDLEQDVLMPLVRQGKAVFAYYSTEYVKDVGTPARIEQAEKDINEKLVTKRNLRNKQSAIFLDRDGTVNQSDGLIHKVEQMTLEKGAAEAIQLINKSGYLAIIITNQPSVARGLCSISDIEQIHNKLKTLLGNEGAYVDDIRFCPHHPDSGYSGENSIYKTYCHCRKPDIGMLLQCVEQYNIDLSSSWFVGDTTTDIRTGRNAGTYTALVLTGEGGKDNKYDVKPDLVCMNLLIAVREIIGG